MQDNIIKLGNNIVSQLTKEKGEDDLLSRWMAHYIAEQMTAAANSNADAKRAAEKECFNTILSLWAHRACLPRGTRPFESFDAIFYTLARLDPREQRPFYYEFRQNEASSFKPEEHDVKQLMDFVETLDRATRVIIHELLIEATREATNDATK